MAKVGWRLKNYDLQPSKSSSALRVQTTMRGVQPEMEEAHGRGSQFPHISNLTQALDNLCKLTTETPVLRQLALRRRGSESNL